MSKLISIVYFVPVLLILINIAKATKKDWEYVMENFEWESTNKTLVSLNMRPIRIARDLYGLDGTINVGFEVDNTFKIQLKVLRSNSGTSQYMETPFRIPKLSLYYFMTKFYKKYAMNDLKNCSNFPQFKGDFNSPVPIRNYYFKSCVMSTEKMPTHMWPGFYKIIMDVEGPFVRFVCTVTSNVFNV